MSLPHASVGSILSINTVELKGDLNGTFISFFTEDEVLQIRSKITEFQNAKANGRAATVRSGGSALLKELEKVEYFKEGLFKHIQEIRDILYPKQITRTTLADKEKQVQQEAIANVAKAFTGLQERMLRSIAESTLGDVQIEYTLDELPFVLATKQITNVLLEPGKVL